MIQCLPPSFLWGLWSNLDVTGLRKPSGEGLVMGFACFIFRTVTGVLQVLRNTCLPESLRNPFSCGSHGCPGLGSCQRAGIGRNVQPFSASGFSADSVWQVFCKSLCSRSSWLWCFLESPVPLCLGLSKSSVILRSHFRPVSFKHISLLLFPVCLFSKSL